MAGEAPSGTDGWSGRMRWRSGGDAVQYLYHPDQPTIYGEDLFWNIGGQKAWVPGQWVQVEHRFVIAEAPDPVTLTKVGVEVDCRHVFSVDGDQGAPVIEIYRRGSQVRLPQEEPPPVEERTDFNEQ